MLWVILVYYSLPTARFHPSECQTERNQALFSSCCRLDFSAYRFQMGYHQCWISLYLYCILLFLCPVVQWRTRKSCPPQSILSYGTKKYKWTSSISWPQFLTLTSLSCPRPQPTCRSATDQGPSLHQYRNSLCKNAVYIYLETYLLFCIVGWGWNWWPNDDGSGCTG